MQVVKTKGEVEPDGRLRLDVPVELPAGTGEPGDAHVSGFLAGQQTHARERLFQEVIRACLEGKWRPLIGQALFTEYEDVLGRTHLFRSCPLSERERQDFFAAFLSVCEWVELYFFWRPNLPDEGDNHIVELAVAGAAELIVTNNVRDFRRALLRFPGLRIVSPHEFLKELA